MKRAKAKGIELRKVRWGLFFYRFAVSGVFMNAMFIRYAANYDQFRQVYKSSTAGGGIMLTSMLLPVHFKDLWFNYMAGKSRFECIKRYYFVKFAPTR